MVNNSDLGRIGILDDWKEAQKGPTENEKRIGREIVSDIITAFKEGWSEERWETYTTMMGNVLWNARMGYYVK